MTTLIANFLCACASFSWLAETSIVSLFLFGEQPYPTSTDEQDN